MRADAARNRRLLIEAACVAFTERGVTASLDDVARAAGVGAGTLYRHFPTRDDLVLALIDDGLRDLADLGARLLTDADPVTALVTWLAAFVRQGGLYEGLAGTLADRPTGDHDDDSSCTAAYVAGRALVTRAVALGVLRADVDPGDVLDMATAIAWLDGRPGRPDGQAARLVTLLTRGLCADTSPPVTG
jgi:AcrR family transcriptional regulator